MPFPYPELIPAERLRLVLEPPEFLEFVQAELGEQLTASDGFDGSLDQVLVSLPPPGLVEEQLDPPLLQAEEAALAIEEDSDPGWPGDWDGSRAAGIVYLDQVDDHERLAAETPGGAPGIPEGRDLWPEPPELPEPPAPGPMIPLPAPPSIPRPRLPAEEARAAEPLPRFGAAGLISVSRLGVVKWVTGAVVPDPVEVWVIPDGGDPVLFQANRSGEAPAPWIFQPGHTFIFSLRSAGDEIDSVTVQIPADFVPP